MKTLSCQEFAKAYQAEKEKFTLLDVRNPDEVAAGSLTGAQHIPLPQLDGRLTELEKSKPTYVFCKAGGRAQKAGELLEKNGFKQVLCAVNGGYEDLKTIIK